MNRAAPRPITSALGFNVLTDVILPRSQTPPTYIDTEYRSAVSAYAMRVQCSALLLIIPRLCAGAIAIATVPQQPTLGIHLGQLPGLVKQLGGVGVGVNMYPLNYSDLDAEYRTSICIKRLVLLVEAVIWPSMEQYLQSE